MMTLQVDYANVLDIDGADYNIQLELFDHTMALEAADWWTGPEERKYVESEVAKLEQARAFLRDLADSLTCKCSYED